MSQLPEIDEPDATRKGNRKRCSFKLVGLAVVWGCLLIVGFGFLWEHLMSPGNAGQPPAHWPAGSSIRRNTTGTTLILFAHPRCPCVRATLGELARVLTHRQDNVAVHVMFLVPAGVSARWEETAICRNAEALPGVNVLTDVNGAEANRFQVETSGHVLMYDAEGALCFSGGITSGRGHEGDSDGGASLSELLKGTATQTPETPVFGCPLFGTSHSPTRDSKECSQCNQQ